jgi:isopenicillin-N N-acyltransferase-like protein
MAYPKIVVSGNSYQQGVMYGQQAKERIAKGIAFYNSTFQKQGISDDTLAALIEKYSKIIEEKYPECYQEIKGISEGSGIPLGQIVAMNCRSEILQSSRLMAPECTVFAALPEVTADGHAYCGQNWDWFPECAEFAIVLEAQNDNGPDSLIFVEAGMLCRNGMNSAGIGVCGNGLTAKGDAQQEGIPIPLVRRSMLESDSYGYAIEKLICSKRASSANYIVADKAGMAINFEMTPNDFFQMYPENGVLAHANHFIAGRGFVEDVLVKGFPDSVYRYWRAKQLLQAAAPKITLDDLKAVFSDHFGYPRAICRHFEEKGTVGQYQTVASIIMDLTAGILYVSEGNPCTNEHVAYTFSRKK